MIRVVDQRLTGDVRRRCKMCDAELVCVRVVLWRDILERAPAKDKDRMLHRYKT